MPNFDILRKAEPAKTFRVASVMGAFDLQTNAVQEHFCGSIDLPDAWNVGLIVGASGTGKTTIAKELFGDQYIERFEYTHECLLDDMPQGVSVSDITRALTSVGFSSVPSWLKSYAMLSNGEKMRCDLARAILSDNKMFVFDEFTSVVDRNVAKVGSYAMQRAVRKAGKQFVAVTCHYDVEDWLLPDWVFDTNTMTFRICEGQKKNKPECRLRVYETKAKEHYWRIFGKYHYLNHEHHKAARVFVATLNDDLCAFLSVLHFVHPKKHNTWRVHRAVVLPDYQGIGVGGGMMNFVADLLAKEGKNMTITTSSPSMISALRKSPLWRMTRHDRVSAGSVSGFNWMHNKHNTKLSSNARITTAFEYKKQN